MRLQSVSEVSNLIKPDETEQILCPKQHTIKNTLELLRSDSVISADEVSQIQIEFDDFKEALKKIVPSSKREGFVTVPNVTWDDIGSLKKIKQELFMAMLVGKITKLLNLFYFFLKYAHLFVIFRLPLHTPKNSLH